MLERNGSARAPAGEISSVEILSPTLSSTGASTSSGSGDNFGRLEMLGPFTSSTWRACSASLRQRLIDVYSDLLARRHLTGHQVRADQLAGDVERHASLPPNGNGYRVRRSPRRSTPCCPGAIGLTTLLAGHVVRCRRHVPRPNGDGDAAGTIGVPFELPAEAWPPRRRSRLRFPTTRPHRIGQRLRLCWRSATCAVDELTACFAAESPSLGLGRRARLGRDPLASSSH